MSIHRVVMVQSIPSIGMIFQNAVHFNNPDGALTDAAIGAELAANFCVSIRNFQSNFLGWQYLYIYQLTTPPPPVYIYSMGNVGGLAGTGYLYPTQCMKLKWQTTAGGRKGRGRFFIAGGRNDWVTAAGINATAATNGGIHLANIVARYKLGGTGPLVLGLVEKNGGPTTFTSLQTALFWQYIGQQRRRQYGVGI